MNRISLSLASTLLGCSMALATTPDQWTMWVEGDPPPWDALNDWVLNGQDAKLPTGHLVIRLIDPLAPSDQGADYKLPTSPDDELPPSLAFIKNLRNSFDGQISVLPYFDSNTSGWI